MECLQGVKEFCRILQKPSREKQKIQRNLGFTLGAKSQVVQYSFDKVFVGCQYEKVVGRYVQNFMMENCSYFILNFAYVNVRGQIVANVIKQLSCYRKSLRDELQISSVCVGKKLLDCVRRFQGDLGVIQSIDDALKVQFREIQEDFCDFLNELKVFCKLFVVRKGSCVFVVMDYWDNAVWGSKYNGIWDGFVNYFNQMDSKSVLKKTFFDIFELLEACINVRGAIILNLSMKHSQQNYEFFSQFNRDKENSKTLAEVQKPKKCKGDGHCEFVQNARRLLEKLEINVRQETAQEFSQYVDTLIQSQSDFYSKLVNDYEYIINHSFQSTKSPNITPPRKASRNYF